MFLEHMILHAMILCFNYVFVWFFYLTENEFFFNITHKHTCGCFNYMKVIKHKPYDHKADVFGFGIVAWELQAREVSTTVCRRKKKVVFLHFILLLVSCNCKKFITYYSLHFMTKITASLLILDRLQAAVSVAQKVYPFCSY